MKNLFLLIIPYLLFVGISCSPSNTRNDIEPEDNSELLDGFSYYSEHYITDYVIPTGLEMCSYIEYDSTNPEAGYGFYARGYFSGTGFTAGVSQEYEHYAELFGDTYSF